MNLFKLKTQLSANVARIVLGGDGLPCTPTWAKKIGRDQFVSGYEFSTIDPRCHKFGVFEVVCYKIAEDNTKFEVLCYPITGGKLTVAWGEHSALASRMEMTTTVTDQALVEKLGNAVVDAYNWVMTDAAPSDHAALIPGSVQPAQPELVPA